MAIVKKLANGLFTLLHDTTKAQIKRKGKPVRHSSRAAAKRAASSPRRRAS